MEKFVLHFFKEKSREIDYEKLFSFFEDYPEITVENAEEDAKEMNIYYKHPILKTDIKFVLSSSSTVKEIHLIHPQFLDVNFRLELSILTPYYISNKVFEITRKLVEEFEFYIYNSLLEDAIPFKTEKVNRLFELTKNTFKETFGYKLKDYYYFPTNKLNDCLRYIDEQYQLQQYYKEKNIYVPNYYFLADDNKNLYVAIEWEEGNNTVFPPHLDYIYFISGVESKILPFVEVMAKIEKYSKNVPGFLQNTKVTDPKQIRRITKQINKAKFTQQDKTLTRIDLNLIIDL